MNFSSILDISSFFIGMIINLLLIALICYYFKRKYENLEIAQNEQAKVLYQLLQNSPPKVRSLSEVLNDTSLKVESKPTLQPDSDSDSESDSDSDAETECGNEVIPLKNELVDLNEIKTINLDIDENELNELKVDLDNYNNNVDVKLEKESDVEVELNIEGINETDYSKMTIKQLKEILSVKGINANKLKKNEMIELIEKSSISIDE